MLIDGVKKLSEDEDDFEGFIFVFYKNGVVINFYRWDEYNSYWFDRKVNIFIEVLNKIRVE